MVSDIIETGLSLQPLVQALRKAGIQYDIATVGLGKAVSREELEQKLRARIVAGGVGTTPEIYGRHELSGVRKDEDDVYAKRSLEDTAERKKARKDVSLLAHELVEWYEGPRIK